MKVANVVFLVIFLLCVAVQWNDPDPVRWMSIYGAAAICCLLFALRKLPFYFSAATALIALVWSLFLLPDVWGKPIPVREVFSLIHMISAGVEEVREIGGLLLVFGWMIVLTKKTLGFREPTIR